MRRFNDGLLQLRPQDRLRRTLCRRICALRIIPLILLGAALCSPAAAGPTVSEINSYYDIAGGSLPELVAQMRLLGPTIEGSARRYWARTTWHVRWRFTYRERGFSCVIETVSVSLKINYTYPRWKDESGADETSRKAWARMMSALERHERQHAQHGRDAALEIERGIGALKAQRSCALLEREANALGHRIVEQYVARDAEFDRRTDHGRNEGVHLP